VDSTRNPNKSASECVQREKGAKTKNRGGRGPLCDGYTEFEIGKDWSGKGRNSDTRNQPLQMCNENREGGSMRERLKKTGKKVKRSISLQGRETAVKEVNGRGKQRLFLVNRPREKKTRHGGKGKTIDRGGRPEEPPMGVNFPS